MTYRDKRKGTGRTTRMIQYAVERCGEGFSVVVIVPDSYFIPHLKQIAYNFADFESESNNSIKRIGGGSIIFYLPSDPLLDLVELRVRGVYHEILVDHGVIQQRFHKILSMLHRFDECEELDYI